jgi:ABC-type transport system involved in cytochrome bd biosynthesis fused ATPase/permease subunit
MAALDDQLADRTVVLVTHQPPPLGRAGRPTRVLTLDHGRLTDVDDPVQHAGLAVSP